MKSMVGNNAMLNNRSRRFKECEPIETIVLIKSILKKKNIEVDEMWMNPSKINTYCLRVVIKGTNIGTNGKGITKEYATASAYAEFMERLQNNILFSGVNLDNQCGFYFEPDEIYKTAEQIIKENNTFIKFYFGKRGLLKAKAKIKAEEFKKIQTIEYMKRGILNQYITIPFYNITSSKLEYLPKVSYQSYYGSNGMAAGNSIEEAMVQGISEIYERYVQKTALLKKISFPDIPVDVLMKYPEIYERTQRLAENDNYKFYIKDCSMGGKYPVVALIGVEINTGKYGVKFGCHPDMGIAIERTLTEATQGRTIDDFTKCAKLDFTDNGVINAENMQNALKVGNGKYPYEFILGESDYEFTPWENVDTLTNKEMLTIWIDSIEAQGNNILVRDVSVFDFPTVHIIIPGISESRELNDDLIRTYNTRFFVTNLLKDIASIEKDDIHYIISMVKYFENSILENNIQSFFVCVSPDIKFPGEDVSAGLEYLGLMSCLAIRQYDKGMYFSSRILKKARLLNSESANLDYYSGLNYYCDFMKNVNDSDQAFEYISKLFSEDIIDRIKDIVCTPDMILSKEYIFTSTDNVHTNDLVKIKTDYIGLIKAQKKIRLINQEISVMGWI